MELRTLQASWMVSALGFAGRRGVLFLGGRGEERAGGVGVADGGLGIETEEQGEVERVTAAGEGFFEDPVHSQPFQGGGLPVEDERGALAAGWRGGQGGLVVDEQVRVGGVGPAGLTMAKPVAEQPVGEVERAGSSADDDAAVAEIDVVQAQREHVGRAGGVDSRERDHDPGRRSRDGLDGPVDVVGE